MNRHGMRDAKVIFGDISISQCQVSSLLVSWQTYFLGWAGMTEDFTSLVPFFDLVRMYENHV